MPELNSVMKHNLSTSLYHLNAAFEALEGAADAASIGTQTGPVGQTERRDEPDENIALEFQGVVDLSLMRLMQSVQQAGPSS